MLKSHIYIYMSSFHIYVQITIYMSKLRYVYPNCNICIQMVIYMSKMSIDMYPNECCVIFKQFDVYMSRNVSTYIYFLVSTACKCS